MSEVVHYLSVYLSRRTTDPLGPQGVEQTAVGDASSSEDTETIKEIQLSDILSCNSPIVLEHVGVYHGCCLDTGAEGSVTGLNQFHAYLKFMSEPVPELRRSDKTFKFGGSLQRSMGRARVRFCVSKTPFFVQYLIDVI